MRKLIPIRSCAIAFGHLNMLQTAQSLRRDAAMCIKMTGGFWKKMRKYGYDR
jgi:hypothetical protein